MSISAGAPLVGGGALAGVLTRVGVQVRLYAAAAGMLRLLAAGAGLLLLMVAADHWLESGVPSGLRRGVLWLGGLAGAAGFAWLVVRPLLQSPAGLHAAWLIERGRPDLLNSISTAVQLADDPRLPEDVRAVLRRRAEEDAASLGEVGLGAHAEDRRAMISAAAVLGAVLLAFAAYSLFAPRPIMTSVQRSLGAADVPLPARTRIVSIRPDEDVDFDGSHPDLNLNLAPEGAAAAKAKPGRQPGAVVEFAVEIEGRQPDAVELRWGPTPGDYPPANTASLTRQSGGPLGATTTWSARRHAPAESVWYRIEAGDAVSTDRRLAVLPVPAVESVTATVDRPRYIEQSDTPVRHDFAGRDLEDWAGSRVNLLVRTNSPASTARVIFVAEAGQPVEEVKLRTDDPGAREWKGGFELRRTARFRVEFENRKGIRNRDSGRQYGVSARPDLPPDLILDEPAGDLVLRGDQPVQLRVRARDDIGLSRVSLITQLVGEDGRPRGKPRAELLFRPSATSLDKVANYVGPKGWTATAGQLLAEAGGRWGDTLICQVEAADNRDPHPQVAESRKFRLTVQEPQRRVTGPSGDTRPMGRMGESGMAAPEDGMGGAGDPSDPGNPPRDPSGMGGNDGNDKPDPKAGNNPGGNDPSMPRPPDGMGNPPDGKSGMSGMNGMGGNDPSGKNDPGMNGMGGNDPSGKNDPGMRDPSGNPSTKHGNDQPKNDPAGKKGGPGSGNQDSKSGDGSSQKTGSGASKTGTKDGPQSKAGGPDSKSGNDPSGKSGDPSAGSKSASKDGPNSKSGDPSAAGKSGDNQPRKDGPPAGTKAGNSGTGKPDGPRDKTGMAGDAPGMGDEKSGPGMKSDQGDQQPGGSGPMGTDKSGAGNKKGSSGNKTERPDGKSGSKQGGPDGKSGSNPAPDGKSSTDNTPGGTMPKTGPGGMQQGADPSGMGNMSGMPGGETGDDGMGQGNGPEAKGIEGVPAGLPPADAQQLLKVQSALEKLQPGGGTDNAHRDPNRGGTGERKADTNNKFGGPDAKKDTSGLPAPKPGGRDPAADPKGPMNMGAGNPGGDPGNDGMGGMSGMAGGSDSKTGSQPGSKAGTPGGMGAGTDPKGTPDPKGAPGTAKTDNPSGKAGGPDGKGNNPEGKSDATGKRAPDGKTDPSGKSATGGNDPSSEGPMGRDPGDRSPKAGDPVGKPGADAKTGGSKAGDPKAKGGPLDTGKAASKAGDPGAGDPRVGNPPSPPGSTGPDGKAGPADGMSGGADGKSGMPGSSQGPDGKTGAGTKSGTTGPNAKAGDPVTKPGGPDGMGSTGKAAGKNDPGAKSDPDAKGPGEKPGQSDPKSSGSGPGMGKAADNKGGNAQASDSPDGKGRPGPGAGDGPGDVKPPEAGPNNPLDPVVDPRRLPGGDPRRPDGPRGDDLKTVGQVVRRLDDALRRGELDPAALRDIGMTPEAARQFVDRFEKKPELLDKPMPYVKATKVISGPKTDAGPGARLDRSTGGAVVGGGRSTVERGTDSGGRRATPRLDKFDPRYHEFLRAYYESLD